MDRHVHLGALRGHHLNASPAGTRSNCDARRSHHIPSTVQAHCGALGSATAGRATEAAVITSSRATASSVAQSTRSSVPFTALAVVIGTAHIGGQQQHVRQWAEVIDGLFRNVPAVAPCVIGEETDHGGRPGSVIRRSQQPVTCSPQRASASGSVLHGTSHARPTPLAPHR